MKTDAEYLWNMSGTFLFHCYSEMEYEMFERWGKITWLVLNSSAMEASFSNAQLGNKSVTLFFQYGVSL